MGSEKVDRLSNMPDEVISHILSLMRTGYAVRTCVLSKSWIHTWKSVTNLDFDNKQLSRDISRFTKFVNQVLEFCKPSQLFRLHCFCIHRSFVCEWIDKAVRLSVCELDIKATYLVLPHSLFTCKTLIKLSLRSIDNSEHSYPSSVNLPCLKTIDIVTNDSAFVNALTLIRGCPVLESLSLKIKISDPSYKDYNFNIPSLKHMKLRIKEYTYCDSKVVLNVPKLEDLYVRTDKSTGFVMEDLSSLISVTLSYYSSFNSLWVVEVLKGVTEAKSLMLELPLYPSRPFYTPIPNFPNLKHLEFNASFAWNGLDWALFHQIVENCPELEHLCIIMNPEDQRNYCWIEPQSVPTCMLNNLGTMKFENFKGQESHLQFLAYLLGNAAVLTKLTIKCVRIPLKEEMLLTTELLKLPRVSRYCEIHFLP